MESVRSMGSSLTSFSEHGDSSSEVVADMEIIPDVHVHDVLHDALHNASTDVIDGSIKNVRPSRSPLKRLFPFRKKFKKRDFFVCG